MESDWTSYRLFKLHSLQAIVDNASHLQTLFITHPVREDLYGSRCTVHDTRLICASHTLAYVSDTVRTVKTATYNSGLPGQGP